MDSTLKKRKDSLLFNIFSDPEKKNSACTYNIFNNKKQNIFVGEKYIFNESEICLLEVELWKGDSLYLTSDVVCLWG